MAKELTIGSLKYNRVSKTIAIDHNKPIQNEEKASIIEKSSDVGIQQHNRYYEINVKKGQSILDAALEKDLPLEYKCKKGTCGKCKVKVMKGNTYLHRVNSLEEKRLQGLVDEGYRLACQAVAK